MCGIKLEGLEEFEKLVEDMTITEMDAKKAIRKAINPIAKEIQNNTPRGYTGQLKRIKKSVKKEGLATVGTIKTTAFYDFMQEFGTSYQKANVGYFDRSIKATENKAIEILANELLDKVR